MGTHIKIFIMKNRLITGDNSIGYQANYIIIMDIL